MELLSPDSVRGVCVDLSLGLLEENNKFYVKMTMTTTEDDAFFVDETKISWIIQVTKMMTCCSSQFLNSCNLPICHDTDNRSL